MSESTFFVITLDYRQLPEGEPGWLAALDEAPSIHGHGFTPREAVESLAGFLSDDSDPAKMVNRITAANETAAREEAAYQEYLAARQVDPNKESP